MKWNEWKSLEVSILVGGAWSGEERRDVFANDEAVEITSGIYRKRKYFSAPFGSSR
jgi:hypothetical protein